MKTKNAQHAPLEVTHESCAMCSTDWNKRMKPNADNTGWICNKCTQYEKKALLESAAPDLLEAAKKLVALVHKNDGVCKEKDPEYCEVCAMSAAIAKAEGK